MNQHKTGLTVGAFVGVLHLGWSILVMLGLAQPLHSWILSLHAIESSSAVGMMGVGGLVSLVVVAAVAGYAFGWLFAKIWNKINK